MMRSIFTILLSALLCASLIGCKGGTKTKKPQAEHPKADSAQVQQPSGEHPQADTTKAEHPQGEHP